MSWDVFVSYASEDREEIARPLADELQKAGLRVWFDGFELRLGDSLRQKIDEGLAESAYGVVILSENFFAKAWPQRELNGLVARDNILPVWHKIGQDGILKRSPILADKVGVRSDLGLTRVVAEILRVAAKNRVLRIEATPICSRAHDKIVTCGAFSRDGDCFASGSEAGTIKLIDLRTGEERNLKDALAGGNGVEALAFSADDKLIAGYGYEGAVKAWDTRTLDPVFEAAASSRWWYWVGISLSTGLLIVGGSTEVSFWDLKTALRAGAIASRYSCMTLVQDRYLAMTVRKWEAASHSYEGSQRVTEGRMFEDVGNIDIFDLKERVMKTSWEDTPPVQINSISFLSRSNHIVVLDETHTASWIRWPSGDLDHSLKVTALPSYDKEKHVKYIGKGGAYRAELTAAEYAPVIFFHERDGNNIAWDYEYKAGAPLSLAAGLDGMCFDPLRPRAAVLGFGTSGPNLGYWAVHLYDLVIGHGGSA